MATILIVDDDPDICEVLSEVIAGAGFRVLTAQHGTAAFLLARQHHPDVVLTDMFMPGLTGAQLCRGLRADPVLKTTPVAILSGALYKDDPRCNDTESCTVMLEPMPNRKLVETVRRLLEYGRHDHDSAAGCYPDNR